VDYYLLIRRWSSWILLLLFAGDNVLTAVSVSRQCGLVPAGEPLVFANAYPPEEGIPARISWELSTDDYGENNRAISDELHNGDVSHVGLRYVMY